MQTSLSKRDHWVQRAITAVAMAKGAGSICDIGCGWPTIACFIEPGTKYFPYDLHPKSKSIRSVDMEKELKAIEECEFYLLLGVIEHIEDIEMFFENVRKLPGQVVLSFSAWQPNTTAEMNTTRRCELTSGAFASYISKSGRSVEAAKHLTPNEVLLRLR